MKQKLKKLYNACILLIGVVLLLYLCLSENGLLDLAGHIGSLKTGWLALAFAGMLGELLLDALLIYRFTRLSHRRYTLRHALRSGMTGHFYSAITPFQTGGQPMQVFFMSRQGVDPGVSTAALIQKFLVYQSCLTAYSAFAILACFPLFGGQVGAGFWGLAFAGFCLQAAIIAALVLFSFSRRLTRSLLRFVCRLLQRLRLLSDAGETARQWEGHLDAYHACNRQLLRRKVFLLRACLLTVAQLTCLFSVSYSIYRAFGFVRATALEMLCAQAFVTMLVSVVPLPGAAGASEGGFYVFFSLFFTAATVKSATAIWRFITYYAVILITAPFSFLRKTDKKAIGEKQDEHTP